MRDVFEYGVRPGYFGLGIVGLIGLALLAASLWTLVPGIVVLTVVPALVIGIWKIRRTPAHGLRIGPHEWHVLDGPRTRVIRVTQIAYLRLDEDAAEMRATLILTSGEECALPIAIRGEPLALIRDATASGVPVRSL